MRRAARVALAVALAAPAITARAQTMLDQQQRLIDIHDLLLALPPAQAPGALPPLTLDLGSEVIIIPSIDGTTGDKRQITASDHTPAFPRPRVQLGLPALGPSLRAFVGLAYVPPITIADVNTHVGGIEGGLSWSAGPLAIGARLHALHAFSTSPVTDPTTRDALETWAYGGEVAAGYTLGTAIGPLTPYAGVGVTRVEGRFRITSDGVVLRSDRTAPALHGGVRAVLARRFEAIAELDAFPGVLVHPVFRLAYLLDLR